MFRSSDLQRDCKQKTSCFNQLKGQLAAGGGLGGAGGEIHQQISWPIDPIDDREVTQCTEQPWQPRAHMSRSTLAQQINNNLALYCGQWPHHSSLNSSTTLTIGSL